MSNVLIGIIGVVLFIGLALAGALILGDDFRSSTNDTRAATTMQQITQLANAVAMSNVKTGSSTPSQQVAAGNALIPRFLKTAPYNPVLKENQAILVEAGGGVNGGPAVLSVMNLGAGPNGDGRNVCESIQRQSGQIGANDPFVLGAPAGLSLASLNTNAGCIWSGANFYAYVKI